MKDVCRSHPGSLSHCEEEKAVGPFPDLWLSSVKAATIPYAAQYSTSILHSALSSGGWMSWQKGLKSQEEISFKLSRQERKKQKENVNWNWKDWAEEWTTNKGLREKV